MAPTHPLWLATCVVAFAAAKRIALELHEQAHRLVGLALGHASRRARRDCTEFDSRLPAAHEAAVRHAGWLCSVAVAALASWVLPRWHCTNAAAWLTAAEAISSDLLGIPGRSASGGARFFCGNFGLVLLDVASAKLVLPALRKMLRVTLMRGAQAAGLVTYTFDEGKGDSVGLRRRAVNGKRTDLGPTACKLQHVAGSICSL